MQYNHSISKSICTLLDARNTHYSHSTKSMIRDQSEQQVHTKSRGQFTQKNAYSKSLLCAKFKNQNHFKIAQSFIRKSEPKAQESCT
jgi:hypothetical protein